MTDMFGFYTNVTDGNSAGGQGLFEWTRANNVNPLDLHFAWIEGTQCHLCLEHRLYLQLKPAGTPRNIVPVRPCKKHS